jgi:predicted phosphodiesterase
MTRIAIIADIHANLPALDAVLDDIDGLEIDEILVNGDLVGRGPQGSAVIRRIRERRLRSSRGNHEDYLISFRREEVPEDWLTAPEWSCSRWMADELSAEDIEYADALPFSIVSELEPQVRLFHGSPRSHSEGLGKWTDEETLREHLDSIDERVLVVAHTHRPIHWEFSDGVIVNVGSVGLPFNGDPRAQYAVLQVDGDEVELEMRRVDYDRSRVLDVYEESGFLEAGGATAHLLRMELMTARPHLVPFLKWAEATRRVPLLSEVDEFLELFDPDTPMAQFASELERLGTSDD